MGIRGQGIKGAIVSQACEVQLNPVRIQRPFPTPSIADFGLSTYDAQDGMEMRMGEDDWYSYKIPICMSVEGSFFHAEIDG